MLYAHSVFDLNGSVIGIGPHSLLSAPPLPALHYNPSKFELNSNLIGIGKVVLGFIRQPPYSLHMHRTHHAWLLPSPTLQQISSPSTVMRLWFMKTWGNGHMAG